MRPLRSIANPRHEIIGRDKRSFPVSLAKNRRRRRRPDLLRDISIRAKLTLSVTPLRRWGFVMFLAARLGFVLLRASRLMLLRFRGDTVFWRWSRRRCLFGRNHKGLQPLNRIAFEIKLGHPLNKPPDATQQLVIALEFPFLAPIGGFAQRSTRSISSRGCGVRSLRSRSRLEKRS